jgi:hypothetical protein
MQHYIGYSRKPIGLTEEKFFMSLTAFAIWIKQDGSTY